MKKLLMMIGAAAFAFGATDTAMCMAASNKEEKCPVSV